MTDFIILLTQGKSAIVDECDADLSDFKWYAHKNYNAFYARRSHPGTILMHRVILARIVNRDLLSKEMVDHIDGDGLNNRRDNLRLATPSENTQNQRKRKDNKSGFKGVSFDARCNKYFSKIVINGKGVYLGYFDTPEEAHELYVKAATEHYGKFARGD